MVSMKAYKVQDVTRKKRTGIVADSFADLQYKGIKKLAVPPECRVYLEDGTEVDDEDYFETLPPQTVFVFVRPDETWEGHVTVLKHAIDKIFRTTSQRRDEIIGSVYDFIRNSDRGETYSVMVELISQLGSNIDAEERSQDEAWFHERESFNTKEEVMRSAARSRIRKYFWNAKDSFEKASKKAQPLLSTVLEQFHDELKKNQFFGDYFARSAKRDRLCCNKGWFNCQGPYNEEDCSNHHSINPYGNKQSRVLFSSWNLDHVIEKSRQIFPAMIEAAENCPNGSQLNWKYFFELLFTRKNLKLVHIGCHFKGEHEGCECARRRFYTKKRR